MKHFTLVFFVRSKIWSQQQAQIADGLRPPDSPSYSGKSSKGSVLDCAHPHPWNICTPTARPTSMLHYRSPTMHDLIVSIYIALTNVISLLVLSYCGFTIPCCWWMDGVHLKFGQESPHRNLLPGIQDCCSSIFSVTHVLQDAHLRV